MPFLDKLYTVKVEPGERGYVRGREKRLTRPLRYYWKRKERIFTCPTYTISNGASVPDIVLPIIVNDTGKIDKPAFPHDLLYDAYLRWSKEDREALEDSSGTWTKADSDLQFRDSMTDEGMNIVRATVAYYGVRLNFKAYYNWGKERKYYKYKEKEDIFEDD